MKRLKGFAKGLLLLVMVMIAVAGVFWFSVRFKGNSQPVEFRSDIDLEGLLIRPDGPGPHPAILLLHGSGSSHQPYDKLYFRFHANAFVEAGFAVLVYTKRGSGDSDFDYSLFTYEDLLADAQAAIDFLRTTPGIDQSNIGVMGLSESGWFTPELAYRNSEIKFLINRVSAPFGVMETLAHEVRSDAKEEGFTDKDIDKIILPITRRRWQFYIDVHAGIVPPYGDERKAINERLSELNRDEYYGKWFTYPELGDYDSIQYASRARRYRYSPKPYFDALDIPMLYVMGGRDKNIPTKDVVTYLQQVEKNITVKVYPEASHYLYKNGLEDGPYEGWMYYDDYLELMTSWAQAQVH